MTPGLLHFRYSATDNRIGNYSLSVSRQFRPDLRTKLAWWRSATLR